MDDDFERNFVDGVKLAARASQSVASATIASTPEHLETPNERLKKKSPILAIILTVILVLVIVVSTLILFLTFDISGPSIDGSEESVRVNKFGKVEAIRVYCMVGKMDMHLNLTNDYFIGPEDVSGTLVEVAPGVYEQRSSKIETGKYLIDGNTIHFLPDDEGKDYYAEYSAHTLTLNGAVYQCADYEKDD